MVRLFRLAGLGQRSTTGTRSEKTPKSDKAIPASRSRLSEYSTDLHRHDEGASLAQTKSVLSLNKDPSLSYMVRLCNSKTQESIAKDFEERIDNDQIPNRGRKLEIRDDSTLRDDEDRSRAASRQSGRTVTTRSGRRSRTPKPSRRIGRSMSKNLRDRSRSKSRKPPTKPTTHNNGKNNTNNDKSGRRWRTMSKPRGKFVSNKKKWNIALGGGRFLQPTTISSSVDSRTKKKDGQHPIRRPSLTAAASIDEFVARQVARDNTMDNHTGHETTGDRYHPGKANPIDDDEQSLVDGLNAVDDTYRRAVATKRHEMCSDAQTLEEICSFDDSILYAYNDGWLATYDRCFGTVCGFEVDDLPPSNENGEQSEERRSKLDWIKNPSCTAVDSSCVLADIRDDVVMEILGHPNEVKDTLSLDVDQKKDAPIAHQ